MLGGSRASAMALALALMCLAVTLSASEIAVLSLARQLRAKLRCH